MSRSSHHKEKYRIKSEVSLVHCNEGTSARTRPYSFEDIMLRRKSKKAGEIEAAAGDSETRDCNIDFALHGLETDGKKNRRSFGDASRPLSEDFGRISSKRRERNLHGVDEGKLGKQKDKRNEEQNLKTKSKSSLTKDLSRKDAPRGKSERDVQKRGKGDPTNEDSRDEHHNHNKISGERTNDKSVKEREHKQSINDDRKRYSRGRDIDQSRHEHENEPNKRQLRTLDQADTGGHGLEKDSRRKHPTEGKDKKRDSHVNKHGVTKSAELLERKEIEPSTVHHEELRRKRRSGSREHNKDRSRRSSSLSPRARKRMSLDDKSYSSKDIKYQKPHIDTERKRISSNGSNGNQRRYSGSSSGLGGYSPRKRKTEAAAKTPSPANRSPEHRIAAWDHPATQKDRDINSSFVSNVQSASHPASDNGPKPSMIPDSSVTVKPGVNFQYATCSQIHAIDSIQLTQATRPMRRLYVENLPSSTSEKTILECVNNFLMSSGVNHIKGTLPCISCMINKEKNQALLEFLTPEDASAALSIDGKLLSGSLLKIRRPKDFVEPTTAIRDNTVDETHSISDKVEDTSHKIFIGGISKIISPEMLMKIAEAFGTLKAFYFEHNKDIGLHYAFLEYVDHLATQKACSGLNGMKLGGQVLTVVQATPDTPSLENVDRLPFYGIPGHAKPLLKSPTRVLKLKNMLNTEGISIMSETELEEILEDVKLECARFGAVKAVNVVKCFKDSISGKASATVVGGVADVNHENNLEEVIQESNTHELARDNVPKPFNCLTNDVGVDETDKSFVISYGDPNISDESFQESDDIVKTTVSNSIASVKLVDDVDDKDELEKETACKEIDDLPSCRCMNELDTSTFQLAEKDDVTNVHPVECSQMQDKSADAERSKAEEEEGIGRSTASEPDPHSEGQNTEQDSFEIGSVLVEFRREEASCMAAHCLHGRLYDDRIVNVEYVDPDLYHRRFPKRL